MLDFNGNVKTNMNNINIYFGCTGQFNIDMNSIAHSGIEDIFKSIYNVTGSLIHNSCNRIETIEKLKEHEFYADSFNGTKIQLNLNKLCNY